MANWFCSVFNVVCRKRLSSPRCRSGLIDYAWVAIVPGQKIRRKKDYGVITFDDIPSNPVDFLGLSVVMYYY